MRRRLCRLVLSMLVLTMLLTIAAWAIGLGEARYQWEQQLPDHQVPARVTVQQIEFGVPTCTVDLPYYWGYGNCLFAT